MPVMLLWDGDIGGGDSQEKTSIRGKQLSCRLKQPWRLIRVDVFEHLHHHHEVDFGGDTPRIPNVAAHELSTRSECPRERDRAVGNINAGHFGLGESCAKLCGQSSIAASQVQYRCELQPGETIHKKPKASRVLVRRGQDPKRAKIVAAPLRNMVVREAVLFFLRSLLGRMQRGLSFSFRQNGIIRHLRFRASFLLHDPIPPLPRTRVIYEDKASSANACGSIRTNRGLRAWTRIYHRDPEVATVSTP